MAGEAAGEGFLSDYILETLNSNSVAQYREKCKEIGNIDPYTHTHTHTHACARLCGEYRVNTYVDAYT